MHITWVIFILVYVAMGLGKLPWLKIDRTGAAVVGAMALLAVGSISGEAAWAAMSYKTLGLLFGLMVICGAFSVSGFYAWTAHKVASLQVRPVVLLAVLVAVGGALAALLTNAVVVVAMTPLLVSITLARGLNPVPFLLAFCFAANAGSVGTVIGSPKNMIAAQALDVSFIELLHVAGLPALLSLPLVWGVVTLFYRGKWMLKDANNCRAKTAAVAAKLDVPETIKASLVMLVTVLLFVLDIWPQEVVALGAAGILLVNRSIASSDVLKEVDGNLLLLIMGLFVVNAAMSTTGLPQQLLADLKHMGVELTSPLALFWTSAVLSNIVGANPTVMLLVSYLPTGADAAVLCAALTLGTGFASNIAIFSSLAGIVVVEEGKRCGVTISFMEFAKAGLPIAALCLVLSAFWLQWVR